MTNATKGTPHLAPLPAATLAAFLLAGCSSGHVGDSWQCPLAEGGACDSVAAADPAVPDAGAVRKTVLTEPLWRQRAGARGSSAPEACRSDCGGGFDPFGWLTRLLGGGEDRDRSVPQDAGPDATADTPPEYAPSRATAAAAPTSHLEPARAMSRAAEPAAVPLPAEPERGEDGPGGESLRTGDVIARIWIAPFVDADGVYREASHVRVVLEPAGWRLPR